MTLQRNWDWNNSLMSDYLTVNGPRLYEMHTSDLLNLELETILQGKDTLQGMNFYKKYNFLLENIL